MKVLVAGGSGAIGRRLIPELIQRRYATSYGNWNFQYELGAGATATVRDVQA